MIIKGSLSVICLLASFSTIAISIKEVKDAFNEISREIYSEQPLSQVNEKALQKHIDTLKKATKEINHDDFNYSLILYAQLKAAELINKKHLYNEQPIDVSQVQELLDDLDLFSERTEVNLNNLEYSAGLIAAHQIQNNALAHRYWTSCGKNGHGGCMNVLASGYESGEYVVERDLEKAVLWHTRVVGTGTQWRCAGVYSSLRLAILSNSGINTQQTTEYWLDSVTKLREQRVAESGFKEACEPDAEYIARYIMSGYEQEWLDKLASVNLDSSDPTYLGRGDWINQFASTQSLNDMEPILSTMYDDAQRCRAIEEFALKVKADTVELDAIYNYISTLDSEYCAIYQATVARLRELNTY